MKRIFFALTMVALVSFAAPRVQAVDVSFDFFYNNLSGGSWIEVGDYGYCWQPDVAVSTASWRPYSDGYWAYTDLGWTWVSYEDFGWATYHYGRWVRLADYGWVWAPGRDSELEWGPAWVSWRTGGDYIGWAPLPPEVTVSGGTIGGQIDVEFDIGPACYNFVELRYIGEPVLRERIVEPSLNVTYVQQTVNVTNITYKNKTVYNYGPDITVVNQHAARPIQRLKLERQENVDVTAARGDRFKVQGDRLVVAAPMTIKRPAQLPPPPAVKTKVAQAKVDKGWASVGDAKAQADFKQKIRTQDIKKVPPPTGGTGAAAQATTATSPGAGTSPVAEASPATAASPAVSATPFERGRRGGRGERAAQGAVATPGVSPATGVAPAGAGSPAEATTMPERGKHKGRQAEQFPTPPGATSPTGAGSPGEATTTMPERGKHRGGQRGELPTSPAVGQTPPPSGDLSGGQGQGQHRGRRLEQGTSPVTGASPEGQGQGQHRARGLEQGTPPVTGAPAEVQGQGGKHRGQGVQGAQGQPVAPTGAAAESQQGQGQGKGKKKAEEASPAPSPQ